MEHLTRDELRSVLREARRWRERDWVMFLVIYWKMRRPVETLFQSETSGPRSGSPESLSTPEVLTHSIT